MDSRLKTAGMTVRALLQLGTRLLADAPYIPEKSCFVISTNGRNPSLLEVHRFLTSVRHDRGAMVAVLIPLNGWTFYQKKLEFTLQLLNPGSTAMTGFLKFQVLSARIQGLVSHVDLEKAYVNHWSKDFRHFPIQPQEWPVLVDVLVWPLFSLL